MADLTKFTTKLNNDAAGLKDPTKYIVDPGKFGRIQGSDARKYAVCAILNPIFKHLGAVTVAEVQAAFDEAGL